MVYAKIKNTEESTLKGVTDALKEVKVVFTSDMGLTVKARNVA